MHFVRALEARILKLKALTEFHSRSVAFVVAVTLRLEPVTLVTLATVWGTWVSFAYLPLLRTFKMSVSHVSQDSFISKYFI